jgi:ankyrin repeat protein
MKTGATASLSPFYRLISRLWALWLVVPLVACNEPPAPTINLYRAIHTGDLDQIKRHLYGGTDINQPGPDGDYPLHVAAERSHVVVVEELLRHGASPEVSNSARRTPLELALLAGKTEVAHLLVNKGATAEPQSLLFLLVDAAVSDRDALAFVVARGADVNAAVAAGDRPLHRAVAQGQLLLVKRLITLGAEVNLTNALGLTPLAMAQARGRRDIAALLESFGASPTSLRP